MVFNISGNLKAKEEKEELKKTLSKEVDAQKPHALIYQVYGSWSCTEVYSFLYMLSAPEHRLCAIRFKPSI